MSSPQKPETANPLLLFIGLAFISLVVYLTFTNNFTVGEFQAKAFPHEEIVEEETETVEVVEFDINSPTSKSVAQGKLLYDVNCASCHGAGGKGDGVAGASLNPPARNFTVAENWRYGYDAPTIYQTLQNGSPGTSMAAYAYLKTDEKTAIAHYVRTFLPEAAFASSQTGGTTDTETVAETDGGKATTTTTSVADPLLEAKVDPDKLKEDYLTDAEEVEVVTSSLDAKKSPEDRLKALFKPNLKQIKAANYSVVYINTQQYKLADMVKDYASFKRFVTSENVYNLIGYSFSDRTETELQALYASVTTN